MSSQFGVLFRVMTWGESHGGGVGVVIDGCPPKIAISEQDIQVELDRRRPGQSEIVTQRKEADQCEILSGVFEGKTLGTPISIMVRNQDARPEAYREMETAYRPSHADFTYQAKFGIRNWQGGGRASARETIGRVAAAAVARKVLVQAIPGDRSDRLCPADTHDRSGYRLACGDVGRCGKLNRQVPTAGDSREDDRANPNDAQRG